MTVSPAELVICSLRSYLNTCGCCGQVILLDDNWQCSEMMPITTADGNNHAYDLKVFSRAWKKRVSIKKQAKGRRWWWSLFYWTVCTMYDSLLPVLELHCCSVIFNPTWQCWVIWVLTGTRVFCAIILLSPKCLSQALLCCCCSFSLRMFVSSTDSDAFWGV